MKKLFLMTGMIMLLAGGMYPMSKQKASAEETIEPRSTWLWDTDQIETREEELLNFLESHFVTDVFLQINRDIGPDSYKQFIHQASNRNIKVHALDGAPGWVSPGGGVYQQLFFDWLQDYQSHVLPEEKFSGVHLDVEPYLYEGWDSQYGKTVLAYQNVVMSSYQSSKKLGLNLALDIPFWFDERKYSNKYGKGILSEWIINQTDSVTIMAYRNAAEGPNGIIGLVQNEMNYASLRNKKVSIGIETAESSEGNFLSFYDYNQSYMDNQLEMVRNQYQPLQSYNGFSIHSLHSWMIMKPTP
ncbi:amidase [Peribacillus deserti]|uniref:Amidase n=1 Tax=Peribacillus deserti TaxID=673318 RepID=A0A2N5MC18_9BACI|nr:amidase [Peribacillus deserti]PLT31883.1 amidase [Peribacillus deserti]